MKIKLSLLFFLLSFFALVGQNEDVYENWSSIEVDYGLTKNIDIYGGGQLRIKSVGDTYNKSFYEIGAKIKINDYLSSGFGYRGIDELDDTRLGHMFVLKYKTIHEAEETLGDLKEVRDIFIEFQKYLYQEVI